MRANPQNENEREREHIAAWIFYFIAALRCERDDDANEFLCQVKSNQQITSVLFLALLLHPCVRECGARIANILDLNWERENLFGCSRLIILKSCKRILHCSIEDLRVLYVLHKGIRSSL